MSAERSITEQMEHYNEDRGRHPVHDLLNQAERLARELRVMTGGNMTLGPVANEVRTRYAGGTRARCWSWDEAHDVAQQLSEAN